MVLYYDEVTAYSTCVRLIVDVYHLNVTQSLVRKAQNVKGK